jgi:hypothetical protein
MLQIEVGFTVGQETQQTEKTEDQAMFQQTQAHNPIVRVDVLTFSYTQRVNGGKAEKREFMAMIERADGTSSFEDLTAEQYLACAEFGLERQMANDPGFTWRIDELRGESGWSWHSTPVQYMQ